MPEMVEVMIDSVRVSLMSPQRIVMLRERDVERYLPIWVGPYEAEAIAVALQEVEMARPLTHDLLKNIFSVLKADIVRIEIVTLKEDIYYANIIAQANDQIFSIDSRPSDAIALAVRAHIPILVSTEILDTAGTAPEQDIQHESTIPADELSTLPLTKEEENEERLDVFENFLKTLDQDGSDKEESSK